jgi:hypothetical protein
MQKTMDMHAMVWLANTEVFVLHKRMTYAHGLRFLLKSMYLHLCLVWDENTSQ